MSKISKTSFYRHIRNEMNNILQELSDDISEPNEQTIEQPPVFCEHRTLSSPFCESALSENLEQIDDNLFQDYETTPVENDEEFTSTHSEEGRLNSEHSETSFEHSETNISEKIHHWALKHKISHSALKDLLHIFSETDFLKAASLPKDPRTFLKTPRQVTLRNIMPGKYCHLGVQATIEEHFKLVKVTVPNNSIEISVNIDGLPISDSSSSQLYPILCVIDNLKKQNIVTVGIYHGYQKPCNFNDFLSEFVEEASYLTIHGINICGKNYPFRISKFLLDAVAKASVLSIKGHSAYHSCTKCWQEGDYIQDRVCFPEVMFTKRTSHEFMNQSDSDHHVGTTVLSDIPNIDLIKDIPLDYMHLVCLGVVKKFLVSTWCFGRAPHKLSASQIEHISDRLILLVPYIPVEFARKPRHLKYSKQWKATEFRTFLLYTGPLVLKNVLSKVKYEHFMTLHAAITILASPLYHVKYIDYAEELLKHFVNLTKIIYGNHFLSHNIHNLLHLADDVRRFKNLDNFSNFGCENYLQHLKKLVRKPGDVLPQIVKRIAEFNYLSLPEQECSINSYSLQKEQTFGTLIHGCKAPHYKILVFPSFKLCRSTIADSCCELKDNTVVEIKNFAFSDSLETSVVIGYSYFFKEDFYSKPCRSSLLKSYFVKNPTPLSYWPVSEIRGKLVRLPFEDGFVVFPMLHLD